MLAELQGTSVAKAGAATESGTSRMSALMKRNFISGAYRAGGDQECEASFAQPFRYHACPCIWKGRAAALSLGMRVVLAAQF